ncbi:hypothetical protein WJX72_004832 [[Myrmecia] bisecta]|uniref:Uncharacterized protein n=1 Tax=[Myrmecia] bisecta TaxID=41462 RepID=A0AAW1PZY0_9CHLO
MDEEQTGHTEVSELTEEAVLRTTRGAQTKSTGDWFKVWRNRVVIENQSGVPIAVAVTPAKLLSYLTKAAAQVQLTLPHGFGAGFLKKPSWQPQDQLTFVIFKSKTQSCQLVI